MGGCDLDFSDSGYGPVARSCEHNNEPSCPIKGVKCLDQLTMVNMLEPTASN